MTKDELVEKVARAIAICEVCEGEGHIADGLDEAACSMPCPPCFGTGYDARAALAVAMPAAFEMAAEWLENIGEESHRSFCAECAEGLRAEGEKWK